MAILPLGFPELPPLTVATPLLATGANSHVTDPILTVTVAPGALVSGTGIVPARVTASTALVTVLKERVIDSEPTVVAGGFFVLPGSPTGRETFV